MLGRDAIQVLQDVARRYDVRVKRTIHVDPRVRTRNLARWANPPASWYRYSTVVKSGRRRLTLSANDRYIEIEALDRRIAGAFSINHPDHVQGWRRTLPDLLTPEDLTVYVGRQVRDVPVLRQPQMMRAIRALKLGRDEGLHVVNQRVIAFIMPASSRRVLHVVNRLETVIELLTDGASAGEFKDLPERFHGLIPLIRAWSIGDDVERSRKMSRTSTPRLERLVSEVQPHFKAINRHLDRFRSGWPDSTAALAGLAEAASEAILLVGSREWRRQQRE